MAKFIGNGVTLEMADPSTELTADVTLPAGTLAVKSTAGFGATGSVVVNSQTVAYTGKTSTTLTGCTGGTGAQTSGMIVTASPTTYFGFTAYANDGGLSQKTGKPRTTPFGVNDEAYVPGLNDNSFKFKVMYDDGVNSPQDILYGANRIVKPWRIRVRGAGSGKPETTFNGFVESLDEDIKNSAGDVIGATVSVAISGAVTRSTQA